MDKEVYLYLVILFSLIAITIQVKQAKSIVLRHRFSLFDRCFCYILTSCFLIFSLYSFDLLLEHLMMILLAIVLNITPYVHGFKETGVRLIHRGNVSRLYSFEKTSDWTNYFQKNKLKCRFTRKVKRKSYGEVEYLYFDKEDEVKLVDLLEKKGFYVTVKSEY